MEKNNLILIIIALIVIAVVGLLIAFNVFQKEEVETPQVEEPQVELPQVEEPQEETPAQQYQMTEEEWSNLDPIVQQSLEVRTTTEMINGTLFEVGDNYFVIEQSVPEENQEMLDPEEMKYIQEHIRVNINSSTEIFDLSDIKHITVPTNITGAMETLNYLNNHTDDYIIYIYIAAGAPVVNGEVETNYIEWSSWPKSEL
ncbi:MAG: hypothetical protein XD75_0016 [Parcubacteria bacterium 33_209]|nr:MAG: hypothetical protein XD75_0016 [Parcubacteria bacterium 33_209]